MAQAQGTIVQCIGAVIDIQFPRDAMPHIYDALQLVEDPSNPLADAKGFNSALFNTEEMLCNMIKEFSRQLQILHPSLGENLLPNLILFNAKEESISGGFRFQK